MDTEIKTKNVDFVERIEKTIKKNSIENDGQYLEIINRVINWDEITDTVKQNLQGVSGKKLQNGKTQVLLKCLALKELLGYSDIELPREISIKNIYRDFIGAESLKDIPNARLISTFHKNLVKDGLYGTVINKIRESLSESKMEIIENIVKKDIDSLSTSSLDDKNEDRIIGHIRLQIEERFKILYGKMMGPILTGVSKDKSEDMKNKLANIKTQIENVLAKNETEGSQNIKKLLSIDKSINNIYRTALKLEEDINEQKSNVTGKKESIENNEIQLFNPFYKALDEYMLSMNENNEESKVAVENVISGKLKSADEMLKEFLDKINITSDFSASDIEIAEPETEKISQPAEEYLHKTEEELTKADITGIEIPEIVIPEPELEIEKSKEPFVLTPGIKKEGIFNDENLTEDYELGFRFHQLGLKMGFFNVKLDSNNESSRISTAEFFPNKFWPSVKQRSRWIAGICLQNWKVNKWKGNLITKYFLFRDRKPLFSLFGAFFSNVILLYIVYTAIAGNFFDARVNPLVDNSSVLLYLIFANMFFMISRASHRFMFTYNWYGFKYAFFSFFRLILDTFINFFAILRALKVFQQTKKKVVWDSTDHY